MTWIKEHTMLGKVKGEYDHLFEEGTGSFKAW